MEEQRKLEDNDETNRYSQLFIMRVDQDHKVRRYTLKLIFLIHRSEERKKSVKDQITETDKSNSMEEVAKLTW